MDAGVGILGGFTAGVLYTRFATSLAGVRGPDLGKFSLQSIIGDFSIWFYLALIILGGAFIYVVFWMHKKENSQDKKWMIAGVGLAVLNTLIFNEGICYRVIGASTTFPYLGDIITGQQNSEYFKAINASGNWESFFLLGALLAGLLMALLQKRFSFKLIHENWSLYKNKSSVSRIIWAFVGGFILILGARLAGGCTSGHVLSGGMQLSVSSLMFAVFVFAGLLLTGKFFYKK